LLLLLQLLFEPVYLSKHKRGFTRAPAGHPRRQHLLLLLLLQRVLYASARLVLLQTSLAGDVTGFGNRRCCAAAVGEWRPVGPQQRDTCALPTHPRRK
jgi:hypothetical protein